MRYNKDHRRGRLVLYQILPDWVSFKTSNSSFLSLLRSGVTGEYRQYDSTHQCWHVHWTKLFLLVSIANKVFEYVDRSNLPSKWQMIISGGVMHDSRNIYRDLFLIPSAPIEVIRASYKALVSLYHPDHNEGKGDLEKLTKVLEAYKKIIEIKKDSS